MLYLNGNPLKPTIFPDNTSQVWKLPEDTFTNNKVTVDWEFSNEAEIIHLLQLYDLITTVNRDSQITLNIKYLPYGRQDKEISNNATFALKTFQKLLGLYRFHKINVTDPHNWDQCRFSCATTAVYPKELISKVIAETQSNLVCYPDKGAVTKYTKIYSRNYIYGEKVRDQLTGHITSYEVIGECTGKTVLIIDDICDGGMTFKILAKDLLAKGAKEVNLFVTHGIFSKGIKTLHESGINKVFSQDGEAADHQNHIIYRKL